MLNNKRYSNVEKIEEYLQKKEPIIHEIQDLENQKKEYMLLGLRKIDGIKISKFKNKFGSNPIMEYKDQLNKLVKEKLIEIDLDEIRLTPKGIDIANVVWEEFV